MNKTTIQKNISKKKIVLFTFLPLAILLFSLELIARIIEIWLPPMVTDIGLGFTEDSRLFIPDPYDSRYLITHPNKTVAFQNQRFLKNKPSGTLRIFFLGGSSVNYVNYELPNLSERLEETLKPRYKEVEIINCGGLSYGTHRLVLIAREIVNYNPDLVMIYSGHNEFEEIEQLHLARVQITKLQRVLFSSAMMRFIRDRIATYQISQLEKEHNRRMLA
ncbi:MAG: SGNH/GDSL hydrolase family protein, partial [Candidatus Hydrogenedens sp.]